ncbi:hypothetical protein PVAND_017702, partial [Polypedilum vanderplanki]
MLENECGQANPLMRLGQQLTSDTTLRDEGISANFRDMNFQPENTFRMDMLLKEMQEMDKIVQQPVLGPKINEVISETANANAVGMDNNFVEFWQKSLAQPSTSQQSNFLNWNNNNIPSTSNYRPYQRPNYTQFFPSTSNVGYSQAFFQQTANDFFKE